METTPLNDFTKWKADDSVSNPSRRNNVTKAQGCWGNLKIESKCLVEMIPLVWSALQSGHISLGSAVISAKSPRLS